MVYRHSNKKTTSPGSSSQTTTQKPPTQSYLSISEWKVKLPLSNDVADAYYVVSTSSQDSNGQPNTIWLGLKSLDGVSHCAASSANSGQTPLASLARTSSNYTDPVSGESYQQKYPDGTTIGGYYYGYNSTWIKNKPCTTDTSYQTQLQSINTAFASAAKNIIAE